VKIRDLIRKVGDSHTPMHVWPPVWASSYGAGDFFAPREAGVLKGVRRVEGRLSLTMWWSGRDHFGSLEWTPPPTLDAVEAILRAHIGEPIQSIGDVDVPSAAS
jgi:hypothetical protein